MAANISSEQERDRRILMIGDFFLKNPTASTRSAAKYFSENFFKISNATVHDYLNRYKRIMTDKEKVKELCDILDDKTETIDNKNVLERVKKVYKMYLDENKTIEEIANELNVSFWVIYRDLTHRLRQIDENLSNQVMDEMNNRSLNNL